MADDQTQSASQSISSSTVDAFVAAPEDSQRTALGKMSAPAKAALLDAIKTRHAAGTLGTGSQTAPTSTTPSDSLLTPKEGRYQMKRSDGKPRPVSYSKVEEARKQGYHFADQSQLETYAKDIAADPQHVGVVTRALREGNSFDPGIISARLAEGLGSGVEDTLAGADRLARKVTGTQMTSPEESLQIEAAKPVSGITAKIGNVGEQVGELGLAPETKLAEAGKLGKAGTLAAKVVEQGIRAAVEQGGQTLVKTGGDTEEAKQAAETGGLVGAASVPAAEVIKAVGRFAGDVGRHFAQVGEIQTSKIVRETEKANGEIAEKAARIRKVNDDKIAQYEKDLAAAKATAESKTATVAEKVAAEQSGKEAEAAAARTRHDNEVLEQEKLAAQRAVKTRQVAQLQSRLSQRIQSIQKAAQDYFHTNYAEVEEAIDGPAEHPTGRATSWEDLSDAVEQSMPKIEGSDESVKPFKDILTKAERYSPDVSEPPTKAQDVVNNTGYSKVVWSAKTPDEQQQIWDDIKESWGPESEGAKFADLKGYYSEAGRLLASPSTAPDVKQALVKFRSLIEKFQQDMADDAGIGQRHKLLTSQYKDYAEGFLDYQGPNKSGSPVALALKGEDDFHRTEPLVGKNLKPQETSRIKQILTGKPTDASTQWVEGNITTPGVGGKSEPAWRYRLQSTRLLDNLRQAQRELEALPKAKVVEPLEAGTTTAAKPPKTIEPKQVKPPRLLTVPQEKTISPERLRELKAEALAKRAQILNHFGTYVATSGVVGGIFALTMAGRQDPATAATHAFEGIMVGAVSPYIIAKVLEKPGVVEALSKPTRKDLETLMKLPAQWRPQVEEALKTMAEEAERTGKIKKSSPWLRILAGSAATKTIKDKNKATTTEPVSQQELDELNDDLTPSTQPDLVGAPQ